MTVQEALQPPPMVTPLRSLRLPLPSAFFRDKYQWDNTSTEDEGQKLSARHGRHEDAWQQTELHVRITGGQTTDPGTGQWQLPFIH